jgi:hypothetical protein
MSRISKINELKEVFSTDEVFCPHIIKKFGENAWNYLSNEFIDNLHYFRFELFKTGMIINQPNKGRTQRGVRCNCCNITKAYTKKNEAYLTAHMLDGCDFDVVGLKAEESRKKIIENKDSLPHPIRLEKDVSWVHWDKRNYTDDIIVWF